MEDFTLKTPEDQSTDYVLGFMICPELKNILLIRKTKPDWQKGLLNGIGGKVELGESELQAMVREFKEETDIDTIEDQWIEYVTLLGTSVRVIVFYCISDRIFDFKTTTEEEVYIFQIDNLHNYTEIVSNLKWLIPLAINSMNNSIKSVCFYSIV